mgnify:FL=1
MDVRYKRINKDTGKPFHEGYQDENGRFFIIYLNKQGNDGYYFEEWAKNEDAFLKKINSS